MQKTLPEGISDFEAKFAKATHKFLYDSLDHLGEIQALVRLAVPNVLAQNGDNLGIGVGEEVVASLKQDEL